MQLDIEHVRELVERALAEDLGGAGDVTTRAVVPAERRGRARILAKEEGVLAGIEVARACFLTADASLDVQVERDDGARVRPGDVAMHVGGRAAGMLAAERTALNFLQRLSGIATRTAAYVDAVAGTGARILDTRKTTPGLRALEKHAVAAGGGENHRSGLFDRILLKENHFSLSGVPHEEAVRRAAAASPRPVIAEATSAEQALACVRGGAGIVLLDNFAPAALARTAAAIRAAARAAGREVLIEASGGVTLATVRAVAQSGVDRISVGELTHSVRALDLSMLVEEAC